nr:POTRA domain-containing protein [Leptolyngbya sp. CCY15150]
MDTFVAQSFQFLGNTQFTDAELTALVENYTGQILSYLDLIEVNQVITQFYVEQGYITSGAVIRSDQLTNGIAIVQIVEGQVDEIVVTGTERLRPSYVRSLPASFANVSLEFGQN